MRLFALLTWLLSLTTQAADFLPAVERILFLGDSITQDGRYVDEFERFLFTEFPERRFEVIPCGLSSETVSGLSEEGHAGGKFPRPDLHERLERVLERTQPQLVFASYGMNDAIYLPFDEVRFARFKEGILRLREKVLLSGASIIHLTPAVFDPEPIRDRLGDETNSSATRLFAGYNDVLARYAGWLMEPRNHDWRAIDIHSAMAAEIAKRRKSDPTFTFSKDGIHPDADGHRLMALALIRQLAPERAAAYEQRLESDLAERPEWEEMSSLIQKRRKILGDAWLTATGHQRPGIAQGLPLPEAQEQAAEFEKQIRALVRKLPPARE